MRPIPRNKRADVLQWSENIKGEMLIDAHPRPMGNKGYRSLQRGRSSREQQRAVRDFIT